MIFQVCVFCRNNGEDASVYTTHTLMSTAGKVICPILFAYKCPICHATGDYAHTLKYCPMMPKGISTSPSPPSSTSRAPNLARLPKTATFPKHLSSGAKAAMSLGPTTNVTKPSFQPSRSRAGKTFPPTEQNTGGNDMNTIADLREAAQKILMFTNQVMQKQPQGNPRNPPQVAQFLLKLDKNKPVPSQTFNNSESVPRGFNNSESVPRSFNNSESVSRGFNNSESVPRGFNNSESVPRGFNNSESVPRSFNNSESVPRRFNNSESVPRGFNNSESVPRGFNNSESVPRGFNNSESVPRSFNNSENVTKGFFGNQNPGSSANLDSDMAAKLMELLTASSNPSGQGYQPFPNSPQQFGAQDASSGAAFNTKLQELLSGGSSSDFNSNMMPENKYPVLPQQLLTSPHSAPFSPTFNSSPFSPSFNVSAPAFVPNFSTGDQGRGVNDTASAEIFKMLGKLQSC